MGGDHAELRYSLAAPEGSRFRGMLGDATRYAYILNEHLKNGGSLEDL